MDTNLISLLNVLVEPPGDLIFHLVVCLALILLMGITLRNLKISQSGIQHKQTLIGCGVILFFQLLLFGLRPINLDYSFNASSFYPLIERLAATLTIPWLVWIFTDHKKHTIPIYLIVILSCTLIILAGVSIIVMPRLTQLANFNHFLLDLLWQFIALVLALSSLVLVVFNPPPQQSVIILILLLFTSGHTTQILLHANLQWNMSAIRFAQTLSLPWTLVLTQCFSQTKSKAYITNDEEAPIEIESLSKTKPALVNQLLKIGLTDTIDQKYQAIAQALSLSVIADICYLVRIQTEGEKIDILAGYDLIRETFLNPDTLSVEDLPHIMTAWQANQLIEALPSREKSRDAVTLAKLLHYHSVGNLFAYPLSLSDNSSVGGVIFLSPYTRKTWDIKIRHLMDEIKVSLGQVLFAPSDEIQASSSAQQVQQQIDLLVKEQQQLRQNLTEKETLIREKETIIQDQKARFQIEKIQTTASIDQLQSHIKELSSVVSAQKKNVDQMEQLKNEIRQLTNEKEQLKLTLRQANTTIKDLQTQTGQTGPIRLSLDSQIISLDSIAANIRLQVASQLKKKDIDLEINNPDGRLMIKTDPELLQTALLELITNAIKASAPGGTIRLDQKLSLEMGMLIIQVTDFGDGLSQVEQTALFSGQHDIIPGIGDVQTIRKAIRAIRVLNGKIWLKSKKASYTTFRFQIPVRIID